ncbi:ras and Rab interactor-like protein [Sarcophilus harrisii]|uniref:ras and Rab interactor-like protein n=1 Tax=Sarcophilus harrisii TaxID=9305 RepID=UPI001301CA18|nr:ras and Rab interactor-like protein [Sarcophilus harrisii]
MQSAEDSGARRPQEGERLPELTLRLMRTRGLWHIPDLDARSALDILALQPPGSFLVTGFGLSLALTMSTAPHLEALGTFRILESSAGVTLQGSRLSFPGLPALLAFLCTSRDILPQPLILPPGSLGPGAAAGKSPPSHGAWPGPPDPPIRSGSPPSKLPWMGTVQVTCARGALSVLNPLYLRCHEPQGVGEKNPEMAQRDSLAPQPVGSHRVSWIEGAPCPEPEPEVRCLHSLEEGEDGLVEGEAMVEAAVCWVLLRVSLGQAGPRGQSPSPVGPGGGMQAWALQEAPRPEAPGPSPRADPGPPPRPAPNNPWGPTSCPRPETRGVRTEATQLDVEFLMEILDPAELLGEEGGGGPPEPHPLGTQAL